MSIFVLVHGAWGGAHGFRRVRRLLQAEGHEVYTPSLTGIGERVHLTSPLVNLSTHIHDVANHILYEDLRDIVLVGFSYGGFVVTGVLEHIAERVAHLVYLDAFVPANGDSVVSLRHGSGRPRIELDEDWLTTGPARDYDDPEEGKWMTLRRTTHPKACFTEPVYLEKPLEDFPFSLTYIKATRSPPEDPGDQAFWKAAKRAQTSPAWRYFEVASNHMMMVNKAEETARLLMDVPEAR